MKHREVIEHRFFLVFNHTVQFQCVVSEFEENGEALKENEMRTFATSTRKNNGIPGNFDS